MTRPGIILLMAFALAPAADTCLECHTALEGNLGDPAKGFAADIHRQRGFGCHDCHGGDPKLTDPEASMSPARGFAGKISRTNIAKMCSRCHSDATLMHKFNPRQRVDQYTQFLTSVHGKRLAAGDTAAATCIDCHGVHDTRAVKDALSPTHPLRIPQTCGRCHSDAEKMARYKISTSQLNDYRQSVHWHALEKRGDLSAPNCASCHGNHGAAPPEVSSVAAVCGTCHVLLQDLFNKSPHQPVFAAMTEGACVICHSNHKVEKPSPAMLAGEASVCTQCHDATSAGGVAAAQMAAQIKKLTDALNRSDAVLREARGFGMEVSEAMLKQIDARERLVKARVAVHSFQMDEFNKPVQEGLALAEATLQAGEQALKEKDWRRVGLGLSLITILVTIAGLRLAIRRLESEPASPSEGGG
jgi:predicted CXXCH cytochrome family protein